jgi:tetratricopeptide (TPR) repeat protein
VVLALAICVLLALAVLFALPQWVERRPPPAPPAETGDTPAASVADRPPSAPPAVIDSEARRAAQDALARVQELRAELEAAAVEHWAAEAFAAAHAEAERGAAAYRAQDYATAQSAYEKAASDLAELRDQIEPRIQRTLDAGEKALAAGDGAAAQEAFAQVLSMAPEHPGAEAGLARVAALPRVRELSARGERLLEAGDAAGAATAFESALALDPADPQARAGAARAAELGARQRYQAALGAGFAALRADRHAEAADAFARALELRPQAQEARDGLAQARSRARAARINRLLDAARQAAAAERWPEAAEHHRAALAIDAGLVEARDGLETAQARADLDKRLTATLAAPQRLGSTEVQGAAQALLDRARAIPQPGPRLRGQIRDLQQALAAARIPVPVVLRSDGKTRVTVLRVGTLGTFEQRDLELPPGDYVALGERAGYRDVRVSFPVRAGDPPPPVVVICRESI